MKRTKSQKGITLVALIITIVVLLILAVAAINTITNENILGEVKKTLTEHNKSVKNESNTIKDLDDWFEGQSNSITSSSKKEISVTVGTYSFRAIEGMTWEEWFYSSYNTFSKNECKIKKYYIDRNQVCFWLESDNVWETPRHGDNGYELTDEIIEGSYDLWYG